MKIKNYYIIFKNAGLCNVRSCDLVRSTFPENDTFCTLGTEAHYPDKWVPDLSTVVYYLFVLIIIEAEECHFTIHKHYNEDNIKYTCLMQLDLHYSSEGERPGLMPVICH